MSSPMEKAFFDAELNAAMQSASMLKEAIESVNDAIMITGTEMDYPGPQIEYVNKAFCMMTGYTPEEMIGQTPRILQGPETDPNLRKRLRQELLRYEEFTGETVNYRKDGSSYDVEWRVSPIRDDRGKVHKWVAIQQDITERKRNEKRLREADANKDVFLATLAHELRNPLAPLQSSLSILQRDPSPQLLTQTCEIMGRQLDYMVRLVDDLLDLARLKSGKIVLKKTQCKLADSIQAAVEMARSTIEAKHQQFNLELPNDDIRLLADPSRLTQMLSNLLNNASKYTNINGTITLKVDTAPEKVHIVIRDTGCGIARDMLGQIFELYSQVEHSRESSQGGLGIGLSLVKKLIELHGGTIDADSPGLGHGTTFTLRLPKLEPEELALMPPLAMDTNGVLNPQPRFRVLIVDDNRDGADTLSMLLELQGHETRVAYSGTDALEMACDYRPDVIFSDIQLPGLDGCELARRIRVQCGSEVILAAMTGLGADEDRDRTQAAGFDHHFVKPIKTEELELVFGLRCSASGVRFQVYD